MEMMIRATTVILRTIERIMIIAIINDIHKNHKSSLNDKSDNSIINDIKNGNDNVMIMSIEFTITTIRMMIFR